MQKRHKKSTAEAQVLAAVIKKWKLNQNVLATEMEMNVSTFTLKLNETNGSYRFTEAESMKLASVIDRLMADLQNVLNTLDDDDSDLLGSKK